MLTRFLIPLLPAEAARPRSAGQRAGTKPPTSPFCRSHRRPPRPHESSDTSSSLAFLFPRGWPWGWALKPVGEQPRCRRQGGRKSSSGAETGTKSGPQNDTLPAEGTIRAGNRWVPARKNQRKSQHPFHQERMRPTIHHFQLKRPLFLLKNDLILSSPSGMAMAGDFY